jgi:mono/diheme cytochrome c family protein
MVALGLVFVVASWLPLVIFARARTINKDDPRVQIMQDMGVQPKFREQQSNGSFLDGRADRLPVPHTVARGHLEEDDHYYRGYAGGRDIKDADFFFNSFPEQVKVDKKLLERGQNRFNIYCSVCHGFDGHGTADPYGGGSVNKRAMELMATQSDPEDTKWTPAANLTSSDIMNKKTGEIFNTINVGIKKMPPYGAQIPVEDRWAIVAYVRALQLSENAPPQLSTKAAPK